MDTDDPEEVLAAIPTDPGERKLRLYAAACCRSIKTYIRHEDSTRAVEIADLYADGRATPSDLRAARHAAEQVVYSDAASEEARGDGYLERCYQSAAEAALAAVGHDPAEAAGYAIAAKGGQGYGD